MKYKDTYMIEGIRLISGTVSGFVKTNFLLKASLFLLVFIFVMPVKNHLYAQWVEKRTSQGFILPDQRRPVIEALILNGQGNFTSTVYPGINRTLEVVIKNTGDKIANNCRIKVHSDSPDILIQMADIDPFSISPQQTLNIKIPFIVASNATEGPVMLTLTVEEENGFHMFPDRIVNLFIEERPDFELIISDIAVRDQLGVGYFQHFQNVELFFRVQNCAQQAISNINARIELSPDLQARRLNPAFNLGTLQSGEYRDISAVVQSTLQSENISLDLLLDYNEKTEKHAVTLEFLTDYKTPEQLIKDGCNEFISFLSEGKDTTGNLSLPALEHQDNRFAIVIGIENYALLDNLDGALADAREFADFLINHMGYKPGNVLFFTDNLGNNLRHLDQHPVMSNMQRNWRRRIPDKEFTFYFIGYGATDNYNGDIYLLPRDYSKIFFSSRVNITEIYEVLNNWKSRYDFRKVTAFFNIFYQEKSITGNKKDNQFSHIEMQRKLQGITTIMASSHHQSAFMDQENNISIFTKMLIKGLEGAADLDGNGRVSAFEIYRFLSDELEGIPARTNKLFDTFSVPVLFGQDIIIY